MAAATPTNGPPTQKVSDVIPAFRPTRKFRSEDGKAAVTSLDFDDTGELAIVARDDDTLQMYNCKEGKHAKELKSQKYGAHLARFSHHAQSIVYASTKVDDTIRFLSTHDNSYIRYFRGHTDTVTCIALSPSNDQFISCGLDNHVRLWNLQSNNCQGSLNLHCPYFAAFDPSANVIAVASPPTHSILLYDLRNYDKPPFATFDLQPHEQRFSSTPGRGWTKIEFSNDGKSLLIGTNGPGHYVLDAFEGKLQHYCLRSGSQLGSGRRAPGDYPSVAPLGQGDVCFTPDGQYVVGGGGDDGLNVWDVHSQPAPDNVLRSAMDLPGMGKAAIVGYNHRMNLMISADKDLLVWLPDPDEIP